MPCCVESHWISLVVPLVVVSAFDVPPLVVPSLDVPLLDVSHCSTCCYSSCRPCRRSK